MALKNTTSLNKTTLFRIFYIIQVFKNHRACVPLTRKEIANKIVFLSPPASHIKEDFWTSLLDALVEKKLLNIQYTSNSGKTSEFDIAPCRLASIENEWYLFCVKKDQTKVLQLAVRNIDHINLTATTFQDDYSEKIENMLDNRFGWFANDQKLERVSVVFDKSIARYMQPRIWQKKEEKEILPNGDLRISFIASANGSIPFFEVRKWILGYGSWVKEISPRKLKAGVLRDLKKTYIRLAESENMEMKKSQNIQLLRQKKAS